MVNNEAKSISHESEKCVCWAYMLVGFDAGSPRGGIILASENEFLVMQWKTMPFYSCKCGVNQCNFSKVAVRKVWCTLTMCWKGPIIILVSHEITKWSANMIRLNIIHNLLQWVQLFWVFFVILSTASGLAVSENHLHCWRAGYQNDLFILWSPS